MAYLQVYLFLDYKALPNKNFELFNITLYGFIVLLKKSAGSKGDKVEVQKFFGYIGLFTFLGLWWLGKRLLLCYIKLLPMLVVTCEPCDLVKQLARPYPQSVIIHFASLWNINILEIS